MRDISISNKIVKHCVRLNAACKLKLASVESRAFSRLTQKGKIKLKTALWIDANTERISISQGVPIRHHENKIKAFQKRKGKDGQKYLFYPCTHT